MPTVPVWPPPASRPTLAPPRQVDVAVVGGGITGVCAARHAAAHGLSVVLLERDHLAAGASGRNAGFLLSGVAGSYAAAVRRYGRTVAREVWALTQRNHDRLLELGGGSLPGHRRRGSLIAAASAVEALELEESAQLLAEDGVAAEWRPPPTGVAGADHGALGVPGDGEVDPAAAVGAIAAPLGTLPGVRVCERTGVARVEQRGDTVALDTAAGEVAAGAVVLAVNAWTATLAPDVPISAVRAQLLATEPVGHRVASVPTYARGGLDYWRQLPDGRLLVGGRRDAATATEVGDEDVVTDAVQGALDELRGALGAGRPRVLLRWSGTMGFSPDGLPLVGPLPGAERIVVCGGYTGHGLGFAAECSRIAVELVAGGAPPPAHLDAGRPLPGWELEAD